MLNVSNEHFCGLSQHLFACILTESTPKNVVMLSVRLNLKSSAMSQSTFATWVNVVEVFDWKHEKSVVRYNSNVFSPLV